MHVVRTGILFTGLRGLSNLIDQMFCNDLVPLLEHCLECIAGRQTRQISIQISGKCTAGNLLSHSQGWRRDLPQFMRCCVRDLGRH